MIFHSLKSVIRTPKKTILFLFLIAILALFLSIGSGMYQSAQNMLEEADDTFTTVVELNYLGDKGVDEGAFYEQMNNDVADYDFAKLQEHSDVLSMNRESNALAYIDEKQINQNLSDLNDYVIIEVFNVRPFDEMFYQATINKVHFGKTMRENTYVMINGINEFGEPHGYDFIQGHTYLIVGKKSDGKTPTAIISPVLPEGIEGYKTVVDMVDFPDEESNIFKLTEAFHVVSKSLPVTMVTSLEASEPYFNRDMLIDEGRVFHKDEYQKGNNEVIMISKTLADFYELKLGDKLKLNLHYAAKGLGLSDYLKDLSFKNVSSYEVVGIFEDKYDSRFRIYMPMADWIDQDFYSVKLARYNIKNGSANKFINDNKTDLPIYMNFTIFDQGYEEAIKPIVELMDTAVLLLILGALSGATILLLYAYLYVYKQRDSLINMLALGAGRRRTISYVLYGSILLVFIASAVGAFISSSLISKLTNNVFNKMIDLYGSDMRYSERAIGLQIKYIAQVSVNYMIPVFIILLMLVVSFILLYSLTVFVINEEKYNFIKIKRYFKKKQKKNIKNNDVKANKKEHNVLFGRIRPISLKFAFVSIIRNSTKSLIVPFLTLILSVFLVFLNFISNIQEDKRATVYDRIPVNAYITTFKNETRDVGGLNLQYDIFRLINPAYSHRMKTSWRTYEEFAAYGEYTSLMTQEEINKLLDESEFFKELHLYTSIHYEYMGISKTKEGIEDKELALLPHVRKHYEAFGYDWFIEAIKKMPKLAYADDLRSTPDFFNDPGAVVEFLSGYSYDSLKLNDNVGMISRNFANEQGVNLGDTIRITAWAEFDKNAVCSVIDLQVLGIYEEVWRSDVIYLPWIMSYDHNYYVDFGFPENFHEVAAEEPTGVWNEILPRTVRAATFRLKNTENLASFRDYLETQGYSEAGSISHNRRAIVIQDKNLEETIKTLDNYIRLMNILIPIMIVLFGIIGFIVSYLIIRNRLNELAIMRSMGAKKHHVFLSFFLEQLILFIIGIIPVIIFGIIYPEYFMYYGMSLGYYILSYLAGTSVALVVLSRAKLLDILFSKE